MTGTMGSSLLLSIRAVLSTVCRVTCRPASVKLLWLSCLQGPSNVEKYLSGLAGVTGGGGHDRALADQQFSAGFHRIVDVSFANKRFRLSWFWRVSTVYELCSFVSFGRLRGRETARCEEAIDPTRQRVG